jgi:hypothetical protein
MRLRLHLIFFSIAVVFGANAQKTILLSGNFDSIPVEQFFRQVEATTPYYFFYDSKQLEGISVHLSVKDQPLQEVLKQAFASTDFFFSVDAQNRVFVTKKVQLITSLPKDFFKETNEVTEVNTNTIFLNTEAKKVKAGNSENKVYEIGVKSGSVKQGIAILSGHVRNERTGEPVINATVFVEKLNVSTSTDQYGYYSMRIPLGQYVLDVQSIGMKDLRYQIMVYSEGILDIDLKEKVTTLKEVVVSAQRVANINRIQMGVERLSVDAIKRVPTVFGEADVLKVVLTLPGVKTVGEVSSGFNVRGGSSDQNLVLLNGATIYNPTHFFGMFSAFNPELVKDIELYKSSIPAKYGGRLSSVLDVDLREGNNKNISGSAGIGVITSRFNIEGPLQKNKTSFIIGARSTYANWLLKLLPSPYDKAKAGFYDVNIGITHSINKKNEINLTAYTSSDNFNLASDTTYSYNNKNALLKWKHSFNNKFIGYFSAGYDRYSYDVKGDKNKTNAYTLSFDVNQLNFKSDFSYLLSSSHNIDFGLSSILYKLHPGSFSPKGKESLVTPDAVHAEQGLESALYISDRITFSVKTSLTAALRYTMFNYMGPNDVNYYASGLPRDESNVVATRSYNSGQFIKTYSGPEARVSFRHLVSESFSIKAGYNSSLQYIHMLSNTTAIAPTDIWKLSDPNIRPQHGNQISLGFYKNLKSNTIETSFEVYYKKIKDYLDYKPGATLIMNHHIETDVINTKGKAYGVEFMIKKSVGKLNGWISYTYSRILLKMDDPTLSTPVNGGRWYPANYDKPHDVTAVENFKVNHRFSTSLNVTYSTGRAITLPVGRFYYAGSQRLLYSERNSYRIPDYFRTDFSMNIDGNYKVKQKTHNSWTIGVYNLTGRRNAFSLYYVSESGNIQGYKLSIFGSAVPFVNFNIKF